LALIAIVAGLALSPKLLTRTASPASAQPRVRPAPQLIGLRPPLAERWAHLDARLRLPPDARFLAAFGWLHALLGAADSSPAEPTWASGSWRISSAGRAVGLVSSYPSFQSLLSLLEAAASAERAQAGWSLGSATALRPELAERLARCEDAAAFDVLARVDAHWRDHSATVGDLLAASQALAQLVLFLPDDFRFRDELAARALAALALAKSYAPERTLRSETYLAQQLGYWAHARATAERLPANDPLRAYVQKDGAALQRAQSHKPSVESRLLFGLRLASDRDADEWIGWYRKLPREVAWRPATLRTGLEQNSVTLGRIVPNLYAAVLMTHFGIPVTKTENPDRVLSSCPALATAVEARAQQLKLTGPFADAGLFAAYHADACHVAVYHKSRFYTHAFGDPRSARELSESLGDVSDPELAALRDALRLVLGTDTSQATQRKLADALAPGSPLGRDLRKRLKNHLFRQLQFDNYLRIDAAEAYAAGLDTRPADLQEAADVAQDVYQDPDLTERLYTGAYEEDGAARRWLSGYLASYRDDEPTLWKLAESHGETLEDRLYALDELGRLKSADAARLRRGYESLIAASPDSEKARGHLARHLEEGGDLSGARAAYQSLYEQHPKDDIASDDYAARIAFTLRRDGKLSEAWQWVEPRLQGMVGNVLSEGFEVSLAQGELERAEKIARAELARYPDSLDAAADLALVLWKTRRPRDAAAAVATQPESAGIVTRCQSFCGAFTRAFKDRPAAEAQEAFKALVDAKLDFGLLLWTTITFRRDADAETAFALGKMIPYPNYEFQTKTENYLSLKQARGAEEARHWIAEAIQPSQLDSAAKLFYQCGADELLWDLIAPEPQGGLQTWMLRTAAFLRETPQSDAHRAALVAYFSAHQTSFDERLGAALVGLVDAEALLERASSESDLVRAAYLLGLRAQKDGDLHGAMRLYQLAILARTATPARFDALSAVHQLSSRGMTLDAIAAHPEADPVADARN
jgi:hypothetical protein